MSTPIKLSDANRIVNDPDLYVGSRRFPLPCTSRAPPSAHRASYHCSRRLVRELQIQARIRGCRAGLRTSESGH